MKRIFFLMAVCLSCYMMQAQELTVKEMRATNDLSASQYRRSDLNGEPCALVKVQLTAAGATFEGNVIPPVEYKAGEYWVYMSKGSKELMVKHPSFLPLHVNMANYGIEHGVQALTTYRLTLVMPQVGGAVQTQKLVINYTPTNAMVLVDSKPYRGNGRVEVTLPVGSHNYIIAAEGYATAEGTIKLTTDAPRTVSEVLMATMQNQETSTNNDVVSSPESEDNNKNNPKNLKSTTGYRIQVYEGGNSRKARSLAEKAGKDIKSHFSNIPVYIHFYSPHWICHVGNYLTYEEAYQILLRIRELGYPKAIIVKGKIKVPE